MIRKEILNASLKELESVTGTVTEIERYAIHDGPGIRSVVFLKGCPLRCRWCCNPETQQGYIETAFFEDKCINCGRCIKLCPHEAINPVNEEMLLDRAKCRKHCFGKMNEFPCTMKCHPQARRSVGESMSVLQVYREVSRDIQFYESSGGGLTISGGEPMYQPEFVYSLLRYSKEKWIDTAMETCGAGSVDDYKEIASSLDVLFVDIKSLDRKKFIEWTGLDNTKILANIKELARLAREQAFRLFFRVPVIPGFNDSAQDIRDIGHFVIENCDGIEGMELLPYHKLGRGKYKSVGLEYGLPELEPPDEEHMERLVGILLEMGIRLYQF